MRNIKLNQLAACVITAFSCTMLNAQALSSSLCSEIALDAGIAINGQIPLGVHLGGGVGWSVGFEGEAKANIDVYGQATGSFNNAVDMTLSTCVDSIDLLELYSRNLLTPEQFSDVLLYLGESVRDFVPSTATSPAQLGEVGATTSSGLVRGGIAGALFASKTVDIYDPASIMLDTFLKSIQGELSVLDGVDETVGSIKSIANVLPLPPIASNYIANFDSHLTEYALVTRNAADTLCASLSDSIGSAGEVLASFCTTIEEFAQGTEDVQELMVSLVGIVGELGDPIADSKVVFDGLVSVTSAIDGTLSDSVGLLDIGVSAVGDSSRQVLDVSARVNDQVETLTTSLDGIASVTNTTIQTVLSTVGAPIQVLADATSAALDEIVATLQTINNTLDALIGNIRS